MISTIQNGELSVSVKQQGAELCSVKGRDGMEYLWQADPAVWARHAPLLFPIVGKLAQDRYTLAGQGYTMKGHGFARDLDFERVAGGGDSLRYRLQDSPATRAQYPFEFTLERSYSLIGGTLEIATSVTHTGPGVMPFSVGEHPGFGLNWTAGGAIEDYTLEFEKAETQEAILLDAKGLVGETTKPVFEQGRRLPLTRHCFDQDALIFTRLGSRSVTLTSRCSSRRLTVSFPGYPALGIWAKPGASFVCIEPWYGHADPVAGHDGDLSRKPGILKLASGATFDAVWRLAISAPGC